MKCWRFDIRRSFSLYVNGELNAGAVARLEDHLMSCGHCRAHLARVRDGHRFARQMPRAELQRDPWEAIEAAIKGEVTTMPLDRVAWWRIRPVRYALAAASAVIALLLVTMVVLLDQMSNRQESGFVVSDSIDLRQFHAVRISDIEHNTRPHIVAEGYVSEVKSDRGRDLRFKIVEDLDRPGPFIVCEIIEPIRLDAPEVGNFVRVYGVSRYDGQQDRQWHEVHPVLNIERMK